MSAAHYVFAGGGTGGHLFPGLAVADALRRLEPDAKTTFFTTTRPLDRELLERTPHEQIQQPVRPLAMKPWALPGFWLAWRRSVSAAREFLREKQPRAVLGLGGYAAGPPVVAARSLGIRTAILNPDAIPGRANRYLARHADVVVLQWEVSRRCFAPETDCRALGCPIRADFAEADAAEGRRRFGLDPERPVLLVTGASQGARTVNEAMCVVWPEFSRTHPQWQLLHLTGPAGEEAARAAYAQLACPTTEQAPGSTNPPGSGVARSGVARPCEAPTTAKLRLTVPPSTMVMAFTHEMAWAIAAADAVVSRAGASTLAELTALGKPSVLLPYPYHRDRHQHANAQVLVDAGAAMLVEDRLSPGENRGPVLAALERLADENARGRMAEAARSLGAVHAADDVAAWLVEGSAGQA